MKRPDNNHSPDHRRRRWLTLFASVAFAIAPLLWSSDARAEQVHLPRIGQQYFSVGMTLQPGFLYDETNPPRPGWGDVASTGAGSLRLGFHQIVSESFIMSAQADAGMQWLNEHTAETEGRADSELAFSWQVALEGRWLPFGERAGWAIGGGPHFYSVLLRDRPLQSLGFGLNVGKFVWQSNEDFLLVEFGYAVPFIQGLRQSNSFVTDSETAVRKDWTFHRFALSIQYGF